MGTSRRRTPPAPVSAGPPKGARTAYRGTLEIRKSGSDFKRGCGPPFLKFRGFGFETARAPRRRRLERFLEAEPVGLHRCLYLLKCTLLDLADAFAGYSMFRGKFFKRCRLVVQ